MITARRAFDHVGLAVPNLDEAVSFFVDAFGFDVVITAGPYDNFGYTWPGDSEPERGTLRQANLVLGDSFNLELLEYTDRTAEIPNRAPRPADPGGWHLCLHVDDIDSASAELAARPDTEAISEVIREEDGLDGLRWAYFRTTWGLVVELIQWQPGDALRGSHPLPDGAAALGTCLTPARTGRGDRTVGRAISIDLPQTSICIWRA